MLVYIIIAERVHHVCVCNNGSVLPELNSRHDGRAYIAWVEPVATPKHMDYPSFHIKGNSVLKVCWADMP